MCSGRPVFNFGLMGCVFAILVSRVGGQTTAGTGESCIEPIRQCQHQDDVCLGPTCARMEGRNCSDAPNSCVKGATCSAGVCKCPSTMTAQGGLCLERYRKVGGACNPTVGVTACYDPAANCDIIRGVPSVAGLCVCMTGYVETSQATCQMEAAPTNGPCAFGYFCENGDACVDGFCKKKVEGVCNSDYDCVPNAYCEANTRICKCLKPYSNGDGLCVAPPGLIYGQCNTTQEGSCVDISAMCVGYGDKGTCFCKESYYPTTSLGCMALQARALHGSCNVVQSNACQDVNAECQQTAHGTVCRCKQGFEQTIDDKCLANTDVGKTNRPCGVLSVCKNGEDRCSNNVCRRAAGSSCNTVNEQQCVSGAMCVSEKCTCTKGLLAFRGYCYRILRTVGGTCLPSEGTDACHDELARCVVTDSSGVGVCVCSSDATLDGTCSTATPTTASFFLLALTAVTSFIAL